MIILKTLRWSNAFSYGLDNEINFDECPLTQLVGANGHGKTSIALVLEEALFNKNSKGVKKGSILNRYVKDKFYTIEVIFTKDDSLYTVYTKRGSTQSVKFTKDGEDISSHTSTSTYKTIEDVLGMDHKTFSQIVFQSSASSLEFLTATDSNRKKFLIDLLSLDKYTSAADIFKAVAKQIDIEVAGISGRIGSINSWLSKHADMDLSAKEIVSDIPGSPTDLMEKVAAIKQQITTLQSDNARITQNNKYNELIRSINVVPAGAKPDTDVSELISVKAHATKTVTDSEAFIKKMNTLGSVCPTCLQDIDKHKVDELVSEKMLAKTAAEKEVLAAVKTIQEAQHAEKIWLERTKAINDYEQYHSLYNPDMPKDLYDKNSLESQLRETEKTISSIESTIKQINAANSLAVAWNAKIDVIKQQQEEYQKEIVTLNASLDELAKRLSHISVLVKTFSPSGLVAYKIECRVKDLEEATNSYLNELSDGRFQLSFEIAGNDKLNVVIIDNGISVDIAELSGGERARVNVAALLGIRKLLQALSNNRINLLFMDETVENLDVAGKEKLVEVLLQETSLNTILVSHGFQHPLLEKVHVVKENNISRIEQ